MAVKFPPNASIFGVNYEDGIEIELVVAGDTWWLSRECQAGHGWWEFNELPTRPKDIQEFEIACGYMLDL